jgi:Glycosyltransferase family 87
MELSARFDRLAGSVDLARWRSPIRLGLSAVGVAVLFLVYSVPGPGFDFFAYWAVDPSDPYRIADGLGAFHYAPPVIWLAQPFQLLSFDAGYVVWTALMAGLLVWTTRSWALAWCAFPPVASEFYHGNIDLLLAAALVAGFRIAPIWVLLPLTKITTGINLLWPLIRHDARALAGVAIAALVAVGASLALQGIDVWRAWVDHLLIRAGRPEAGGALIDISIWLRLPIAVIVMTWASLTARRWAVPIAVALAMPLLWFHSLSVLVAMQPLAGERRAPIRPNGP